MTKRLVKDPIREQDDYLESNSVELRKSLLQTVPKHRTLNVDPSLAHFTAKEREFLKKNVDNFVGAVTEGEMYIESPI